jgi:hypothetical protein
VTNIRKKTNKDNLSLHLFIPCRISFVYFVRQRQRQRDTESEIQTGREEGEKREREREREQQKLMETSSERQIGWQETR